MRSLLKTGFVLMLLVLSGCALYPPKEQNVGRVGAQRDVNGCIPSAGYVWCPEKKSCIRPWEEFCTAATGVMVVFDCEESKTIKATFYAGEDKFVDLDLDGTRKMSVPRVASASGARYAKPDESFVFWNKGDTAFVTEGAGATVTYKNCVRKR